MSKRYSVLVTRNTQGTESARVKVTAESVQEAMERGLALATAESYEYEWVPDDGSSMNDADPYIADDTGNDVEELT